MLKVREVLKAKKPQPKATGKFHYHCAVCKYDWVSRVKNPKECPACKSRFWRTGLTPTGQKATSDVKGDKFE